MRTIPATNEQRPASRSGSVSLGAGARWALLMVMLFPLFVMWALTTAMLGSPDEPAHMIRAQSFARLDFGTPSTSDGLPFRAADCFAFRPEVSAGCQDLTWGEPGATVRLAIGNYPPIFHLIAAIPAVFSSGLFGAYLMRIWIAAVCAALFAWAGAIATRPASGPWPLVGVMVALTPMVAFLSSTVTPSGITGAAASLLVVAALIARDESSARFGRERSAAVIVAVLVLAGSRRDGLLMLLVAGVILTPWSPVLRWRTAAAAMAGRSLRWLLWMSVAAVAMTLLLVFTAVPTIRRFVRNAQTGQGGSLREVVLTVPDHLEQLIGRFGLLDTPIGTPSLAVVLLVVGFVFGTALAGAPRRPAASVALGLVALVLVPVLFGLMRFPYFQGRYLIPIWATVAVVAGWSIRQSRLSRTLDRRGPWLVLVPWLAVHVLALVTNLRRYAVGLTGDGVLLTGADWSPPLMSNQVALVLILVAGLVSAAAGSVLLRHTIHPVGAARPERTVPMHPHVS